MLKNLKHAVRYTRDVRRETALHRFRNTQVEGVCKGILQMLGSLTAEYTELLARLAVDQEPLHIGHELHVGQPFSSLLAPHCLRGVLFLGCFWGQRLCYHACQCSGFVATLV